jgi:peptidoglycan endopeptidase LytF
MKVSRVVLIVVALHVLVIGGIFVFEGCSRTRAPEPGLADNESLPGEKPADMASATQPAAPLIPQGLTPAMPPALTTPPPAAPAQPAIRTYIVRKGDSLWKIAQTEGVSMGDLARINNLTKTSMLQIGQKLQIPQAIKSEPVTTAAASVLPASADASLAPSSLPASAASGDLYVVKSGDTLWKLARQHHITVAAIKQANSLSGDTLKIGQKIRIPAPSAATAPATASATSSWEWRDPGTYTENGQTIHIVDAGESPATIAKKYGIKTDELMRANNITDPRKIDVGQRLVIPVAQATTVAAAPPPSEAPAAPAALAAPVVSTTPPVSP